MEFKRSDNMPSYFERMISDFRTSLCKYHAATLSMNITLKRRDDFRYSDFGVSLVSYTAGRIYRVIPIIRSTE